MKECNIIDINGREGDVLIITGAGKHCRNWYIELINGQIFKYASLLWDILKIKEQIRCLK
jgi:hypothetical protein